MGGGGVVCGQVQKLCVEGERRNWLQGIALGKAFSKGKREYCACVTFPIKKIIALVFINLVISELLEQKDLFIYLFLLLGNLRGGGNDKHDFENILAHFKTCRPSSWIPGRADFTTLRRGAFCLRL